MRHITVPLNQLPGMFRAFGKTAKTNTASSLQKVVVKAREIVRNETHLAMPASTNGSYKAIDTGKYLRSWKVTRATLAGIRGVLITNSAEYMAVIERGRTAGAKAPPLEVIARWAQRKIGLPYEEAKRAAWPIAMAIKRRGLYARQVMTGAPAVARYKRAMKEEMGIALDEASIRVFS